MEFICFQTEKRFCFVDTKGRIAEITFKRNLTTVRYKFDQCVFTTKQTTYDLDDWIFLGALGEYIKARDEHEKIEFE